MLRGRGSTGRPGWHRLVMESATACGYPVQAVGPQHCKPFNLAQGPGVLLVLTLRVLASVRSRSAGSGLRRVSSQVPEGGLPLLLQYI